MQKRARNEDKKLFFICNAEFKDKTCFLFQ